MDPITIAIGVVVLVVISSRKKKDEVPPPPPVEDPSAAETAIGIAMELGTNAVAVGRSAMDYASDFSDEARATAEEAGLDLGVNGPARDGIGLTVLRYAGGVAVDKAIAVNNTVVDTYRRTETSVAVAETQAAVEETKDQIFADARAGAESVAEDTDEGTAEALRNINRYLNG